MRLLLGLCVVTLCAAGCHRERTDLHIVSHSPEGPQKAAVQDVQVVFDKPMVAEGQVGRELGGPPLLVLDPPVAGKTRWSDRQTLVFHADKPLPRATQYHVALATGVHALDGARTAAPLRFTFATQRLEVITLLPQERQRLGLTPRLMLRFSQPVAALEVAQRCVLQAAGGKVVLVEVPTGAEGGGAALWLSPAQPLQRDTEYHLECDASLHPMDGRLGLAAPFSAALHTYGDLTVTASKPGGEGVDADDLDVEIELSNPAPLDEVRGHLHSEPRISGLTEGYMSGPEGRRYHVRVSLDPGTRYEVKLAKGVKDNFGQALDQDYTFSFKAGDAKPRLSMESGTYVVEAASPRYPLWTRNLDHLNVQAVRVPEDKVVPLLERHTPSQYEYWDEEGEGSGEEGKERPAASWKKVGLRPQKQVLKLDGTRNKWLDAGLDLPKLTGGGPAPGLYAVYVEAPEVERRKGRDVVASVTNIGLTAKLGRTSGLVWAVHLSDGKPGAGVKITLRDRKNKPRFSGVTGEDGVVEVPGTAALNPPRKAAALRNDEVYSEENEGAADKLYVLAREGDDLAVLAGDWTDGFSMWNFSLPEMERASAPGRVRGFIQTDRGLYRPGETVHLRGLVRALVPEGLRPPPDRSVKLTIEDPRGDELLSKSAPLSSFGGFHLDVPLSADARLGDFAIKAVVGKGAKAETFRDHFTVEEYRPATFEVAVKAGHSSYRVGDKVRVEAAANYLYGAPMGGGKLSLSVRRRPHLADFPAFPDFTFNDLNAMENGGSWWVRYGERSYSYDVASEELTLDKDGKASYRFPTQDADGSIKSAQDYLVEATVTDESNQSRSASVGVVAHKDSFYLGLRTSDWLAQVGKPLTVQAVAVDTEGKPRAQAAELVVALREWKCSWDDNGSGLSRYHCDDKDTELERRKVDLPASGPVPLQFTPKKNGTLLISLHAKDGKDEVVASTELWAFGGGSAFWRMFESSTFPLMASQRRYKPGDTALLLAQAPLEGATALLTVEREGVLSHQVLPFASGEAFKVPLTARHAPNVYASVVLARGRSGAGDKGRPVLAMGLTNLEVDAADKRLKIDVTTDRPSYKPGEPVTAKVAVHDSAGQPVAAEVAVAVADEGVLQLIGYKTPDPQAAFYAPYTWSVSTSTTWTHLARRNDPRGDEEDGEGGDSGAGAGKPRSKFVSTAFWAPALVTGADGTAEVRFTAPDNLTAFRVMAVGADATDRFGNGEVRMRVAKPLAALPALPRFLTVGDQARAGVVVHNNTDHAGTLSVSAEVHGATIGGDNKKQVELPAGAEKAVLFDLRAERTGTAKLTFRATLGNEGDAVEVSLPVGRPAEQEVVSLGEGELAAGGHAELAVSAPPAGAAEGEGSGLEVVLDASGLPGVDEGLRYLIDYPYGCLEQTTSRVIPMVKVQDLARSLDLPGLRGDQLRGFVEAGIAKILRHQHDDGSFSLWPGSGSEPFLTAYALYGLTQAQRGGFTVSQKAVDQAISALKQGLNEKRGMGQSDNPLGEAGSRAFALYVLAEVGQPDPGAMAKLYEGRKGLPVYGLAFLGRALSRAHGDAQQIETLIKEATASSHAVAGTPGALMIGETGERLWWYMSSDTRTTAVVLSLLLEAAPQHPLVPQLVKGLLASRHNGRWDNTQDNLFSLVALADYARARSGKAQAAQVRVSAYGKELFAGKLGGKGGAVKRVALPLSQVKAGPLALSVEGGDVSYSARLRYARPLDKAGASAAGFHIERALMDPKTGVERSELRAGDVVKVVLRIKADEERYRVALVDHLPAGLEPINPHLVHKSDEGDDSERHRWRWDEPTWQALEMHDDRVAVFADGMAPKVAFEFSYLARATTAGTFLQPSAVVEEMYRPEHRARTESKVLEIKKK